MRSSSRPTVAVVALAFVLIGSPRLRSGVAAQQPSKAEAVSVLRPARVFDGRDYARRMGRSRPRRQNRRGRSCRLIESPARPRSTCRERRFFPVSSKGTPTSCCIPTTRRRWNDQVLHESLGVAGGARHQSPARDAHGRLHDDSRSGHRGRRVCRRRAQAGGGAGHHSRAPDAASHPRHRRHRQLRARRASRSSGACRRAPRKPTATTLIRVVRDQIGHGADWIKVYADYRWGARGEAAPTFSLDEIKLARRHRAQQRPAGRRPRQRPRRGCGGPCWPASRPSSTAMPARPRSST